MERGRHSLALTSPPQIGLDGDHDFSKLRNETIPTAVCGERTPGYALSRIYAETLPWCCPANDAVPSSRAWALDVITRITPIYGKLFDLAFPLPKLYWMATPALGGGMEHWELITGGSEATTWNEGKGSSNRSAKLCRRWPMRLLTNGRSGCEDTPDRLLIPFFQVRQYRHHGLVDRPLA